MGFMTLNALAMAPFSSDQDLHKTLDLTRAPLLKPQSTKALNISKLIVQQPSVEEYTPRLSPLIIDVTNKDYFTLTLQAEYAQSPRCAGFPPSSPYVYHKIESLKSRILELTRQQKNGRLKQLLGITVFHDKAGNFTISEQECATKECIRIILANNKFEKST
jgi:hypothetical protein